MGGAGTRAHGTSQPVRDGAVAVGRGGAMCLACQVGPTPRSPTRGSLGVSAFQD